MNTKKLAALFLALAMIFALAACGSADTEPSAQPSESSAVDTTSPAPAVEDTDSPAPAEEGVWADAQYTEDTELGEGAKTLSVEVTAEDKTITFTIHTDAENLRGALEENGLVSGDESEYGLYVKSVNGIAADYDADGYYWALSKAGEYLMTGVDDTLIADGEQYELVRTAA